MKKLYSVIGMVLVLALVLSLVTNYFSGSGEVDISGDEDNIYEVVNGGASFGDGNYVYLDGNCVSGSIKELGGQSYREYDLRSYDSLDGFTESEVSTVSLTLRDLKFPCKISYNFSCGDNGSIESYDPDVSYAKLKYVLIDTFSTQRYERSIDNMGEGFVYLPDMPYAWNAITFEIEASSIWYCLDNVEYVHYKLVDSGISSISLKDVDNEDVGNVKIPDELLELEDYGAGVGDIYNYVDLSEGKYYQYVKTLLLTGNLDWKLYSDNSNSSKEFSGTSCFYLNIDGKRNGYGTSICDLFENTGNSDPFNNMCARDGIYTDHQSFGRIYVDWGDGGSSVDDFKNFLNQSNYEGIPVKLKYVLSDPIITDVSDILYGKRLDVELRGVDHLVLLSPSKKYVPFTFSYVRFKEI